MTRHRRLSSDLMPSQQQVGSVLDIATGSPTHVRLNRIDVVDTFASLNDAGHLSVQKHLAKIAQEEKVYESLNFGRRVMFTIRKVVHASILHFLFLTGFLVAVTSYVADMIVKQIYRVRSESFGDGFGYYLLYMLTSVGLGILSVACVQYISPSARGSGIPEIKSILGGIPMHRYLTLRALVGRFFGTIFALGSGLSVGKEGPFVHIAAILSRQLRFLPFFKETMQSPGQRRQVIAAAAAAGVTSTFGVPIGGTLFSIEVTASYFTVSGLWRTFFCSVITLACFEIFHSLSTVELFKNTTFPEFDLSWQIFTFALLGILTGIVSGIFVFLSAWVMKFLHDKTLLPILHKSPYTIVCIMCALLSTVQFFTFRGQDFHVINVMFSTQTLPQGWQFGSEFVLLPLYFLFRLVGTAISISLPLSAGAFTPLFVAGAVFGRFFGKLLQLTSSSVIPGTYAIAGAAGLTAGVTRTISSAIIVFELTGQLNHLLPVILVALISYAVSSIMTVSIYDLILQVKGLPFIPMLSAQSASKLAKDVMDTDSLWITTSPSASDLENVTRNSKYDTVPVCTSDRTLVGGIRTHVLQHYSGVPDDDSSEADSVDIAEETLAVEMEHEGAVVDHPEEPDLQWLQMHLDTSIIQITSSTSLPKVHYLFTMLNLTEAFVTENGKLVGVISTYQLSTNSAASYGQT